MSDVAVEAEPSALKLVGTLGFAGLLAGLCLVLAFEGTQPTIQKNRREALQRAVFEVVPGASRMQKLVQKGGAVVAADGSEGQDVAAVFAAYDNKGAFLGYAIPAQGAGFQDTISLIYGYDPRRQLVVGMKVLESKETPGLGDKIFKDPKFVAEFKELAVQPSIVLIKGGGGTKPNEVDGISGATISSKAVVRILNTADTEWLGKLPAADKVPPAPQEAKK